MVASRVLSDASCGGAAMPLQSNHRFACKGSRPRRWPPAACAPRRKCVPRRRAVCRARAGGNGRPRREDNGEHKINEAYEWEVLIAVACSPRAYGYLRTTWTQELLGAGAGSAHRYHSQRDHGLSAIQAASRPFGTAQADRGLPLAQGPSDAAFAADSQTRAHRAPQRGRGVRRRSRYSPESQDRAADLDALRPTKESSHSRERTRNVTWPAPWILAQAGSRGWKPIARPAICSSSILWQLLKEYPQAKCIHVILDNYKIHSSQPHPTGGAGVGRRPDTLALPTAILPGSLETASNVCGKIPAR